MMSEQLRFQATAIIWAALAAVIIFTPGDKVALAFILGIGATASTSMIWESLKLSSNLQHQDAKSKRSNKISRLIESMDDDEVADMEALLAARRDDRLKDTER
jgi:ribosomal protein S13